jgi:hypothetical protein
MPGLPFSAPLPADGITGSIAALACDPLQRDEIASGRLFPGSQNPESTVRSTGIEVDDAVKIAGQTGVW